MAYCQEHDRHYADECPRCLIIFGRALEKIGQIVVDAEGGIGLDGIREQLLEDEDDSEVLGHALEVVEQAQEELAEEERAEETEDT